jgi:hypothetical protein
VEIDEGRINRHIKPPIGTIAARDLRRADVQRMVDAIAQGQTAGIFKGKPRGRAVVTGGAGTAAWAAELLGGSGHGLKSAIWYPAWRGCHKSDGEPARS